VSSKNLDGSGTPVQTPTQRKSIDKKGSNTPRTSNGGLSFTASAGGDSSSNLNIEMTAMPAAPNPAPVSLASESKIILESQSHSSPDLNAPPAGQPLNNSGVPPLPPLQSSKNNVSSSDALPPMISSPSAAGGASSPPRRPSISLVTQSTKGIVFMTPDNRTGDILDNDYDLLTLRSHVTPDFLETFKTGVNLYLSGEWTSAKDLLERADSMMLELAPSLGGDGPSKTLLNYMRNFEFVPPKEWRGYRPLTSK
jgi:hypothetical protein